MKLKKKVWGSLFAELVYGEGRTVWGKRSLPIRKIYWSWTYTMVKPWAWPSLTTGSHSVLLTTLQAGHYDFHFLTRILNVRELKQIIWYDSTHKWYPMKWKKQRTIAPGLLGVIVFDAWSGLLGVRQRTAKKPGERPAAKMVPGLTTFLLLSCSTEYRQCQNHEESRGEEDVERDRNRDRPTDRECFWCMIDFSGFYEGHFRLGVWGHCSRQGRRRQAP